MTESFEWECRMHQIVFGDTAPVPHMMANGVAGGTGVVDDDQDVRAGLGRGGLGIARARALASTKWCGAACAEDPNHSLGGLPRQTRAGLVPVRAGEFG